MNHWLIPALWLAVFGISGAAIPVSAPVVVTQAIPSEVTMVPRAAPKYPESVLRSIREFLVLEFAGENDRGRFAIDGDAEKAAIHVRLSGAFLHRRAELIDPMAQTLVRILRLARSVGNPQITISAFADPTEGASPHMRWQLSLTRARSIWQELDRQEIPLHQVSIGGKGAESPVSAETDEASQRLNRRLEITLQFTN